MGKLCDRKKHGAYQNVILRWTNLKSVQYATDLEELSRSSRSIRND